MLNKNPSESSLNSNEQLKFDRRLSMDSEDLLAFTNSKFFKRDK